MSAKHLRMDLFARKSLLAGVAAVLLLVALLAHKRDQLLSDERVAYISSIGANLLPYSSSNLIDGPVALRDASRKILPVNTLIEFDMRPYHSDYWTGVLATADEDTLINVYPVFDDFTRGVAICPATGTYDLIIRVPTVKEDDGEHDLEPAICLLYLTSGPSANPAFWDRLRKENSTALAGMMKFCEMDKHEQALPMQEARLEGGGRPPPEVYGFDDSIVFRTTVHCQGSTVTPTELDLSKLATLVYGDASEMLAGGGTKGLGYWKMGQTIGRAAGSLDYQPQPDHCSLTFTEHMFNTHQDKCPSQQDVPTYHWQPFYASRAEWLLSPDTIKKCRTSGRRTDLIGDSIMLQSWRGFDCLLRGYGGLFDQPYDLANGKPAFCDMAPIFAPRDASITIDDTEVAKLAGFSSLSTDPGVEVWYSGMWYVSNVPATEYRRGIDRWFTGIRSRSDQYNITSYVVLLTSPLSEPKQYPWHPGWQTSDRVYAWNKQILSSALKHGIKVVDNFFPSTHRQDSRTDNIHLCDSVNIETSMFLLREIC